MVMLSEWETFAKNGCRNRPQERQSVSGMVEILLIYTRLTSKKTKDGVETLNSSTLGMTGLTGPTRTPKKG